MSTEQDELQELLEKPRPTQIGRKSEGECAQAPSPPYSNTSTTDYSQWMVCPNEVFRPSGSTVKKLEPAVYRIENDDRGIYFQRQAIVTDQLIEIDDSASRRVIDGIQTFWKSRSRFREHGILFKRGVLLWGPPGSGKTVTVTFLVRDLLAKGGLVVLCRIPKLTVVGLGELRRIEPDRPLIVILEDIEEMIQVHGEHELLGLLDGEHQVANVVNIATTNYPEQLGSRIVNRPSRFDEVIKIGMPSARARKTYLEHSLDAEKVSPPFARWVQDTEGLSIAHLRELVAATQCLGQPYETTLERLKHMRVHPNSGHGNGLGFQ
jgi:SpoVK/Ycf46/Vps4 family AAA+-type ATPase